jgi:phage terminase Nu1 subunit (DNA packaging protein)
VKGETKERYVDARELATIMGVSTKTIERFRAAGMPSETWGLKRTRRYLPSKCIAWARARDRFRTIERSPDRDDTAPGQRQVKE